MKTIYCFSGLGADERVFQHIDFEGFIPIFIEWKMPKKSETIEQYAQRLVQEQITIQENTVFLAVSFGGMIATEVVKILPEIPLILISGAKTKYEIPFYYRWAGKVWLDKLLPTQLLKWSNVVSYYFFGVRSQEEKRLLKAILQDTNSFFLKWAIRQVVTWKNTALPKKYLHLHGTQDRILPLAYIKNAQKVENGRHFMVWNKKEVHKVLALPFEECML
jgi:pimeloyl-ACP methyl ester carboxylesterase